MRNLSLFFLVSCLFFLSACNNENKRNGDTKGFTSDDKIEKELQEKLILVEDGGTVELPAGKYILKKSLSMEGKKNVTIKGAGTQKTILSFLGQVEGAEGMNITNCQNVTLDGFTIQDAKGDNIKLKNCDGVTLRYLNSTWTTGADTSNGNYGYYPVECKNVLLEYCEVSY